MSIDSGRSMEVPFEFQGRHMKVVCLDPGQDLEVAKQILDDTFRDMEVVYGIKYNSSSSALDSNTWLLMGALNLACRVARLERDAALHTQGLEDTLTKLLDDVPDDAISTDTSEEGGWQQPLG